MQWRLNSGDFQFEQAQQMLLAQLIWVPVSSSFDDSRIVGAAGNPPITQLAVRSGNMLDAIQVTNTGSFNGVALSLLQHSGNGGGSAKVTIAANDPIAQVAGYTGRGSAGTWCCKSR